MAKFYEKAIASIFAIKTKSGCFLKNTPTTDLIANLNHCFGCLMKTTSIWVNTFLIVVDAALKRFYSVLFID